jgi:hypothetical protein
MRATRLRTYRTLDDFINKAKRAAKKTDQTYYVVWDCGEYGVGNDYELDTFYLGATVLHAVDPDGSVFN